MKLQDLYFIVTIINMKKIIKILKSIVEYGKKIINIIEYAIEELERK